MLPLTVVISKHRTGSHAVFAGLKGKIQSKVRHSHFLRPEFAPPGSPRAGKEAELASAIDAAKIRSFVTIVRDPADRLLSAIWYKQNEELTRAWVQTGSFAGVPFEAWLTRMEEYDRHYERTVYAHLGLREHPAPGLYHRPNGDRVFVLNFASLGADFRAMAEQLAGEPLELPRENTGEIVGGDLYPAYRAWAAPMVARMLADRAAA